MNKKLQSLACATVVCFAPGAKAACYYFTQEHVDVLSIQWNMYSNSLSLMASFDSQGTLHASNECVVVCPQSMALTLPGGTPLGDEGSQLWILPQSSYNGVPYVGISAEQIPGGVFNDPFTIRVTRVEGPGQFILWQAGSFGSFDVKMDSRNGITESDSLTIAAGGHAHYNWGFTTNGLYRLYFQAMGQQVGQSTNTLSPETPFTFHIQPLRPFENWEATNWPCECAANIIGPAADPDGDQIVNLWEYAFGNDPKIPLYTNMPVVTFVSENGTNYGALRYIRSTDASDLTFSVQASPIPTPTIFAQNLTNLWSLSTNADLELVTYRDLIPREQTTNRFYQLKVKWNYP